jgi:hypothetical protein
MYLGYTNFDFFWEILVFFCLYRRVAIIRLNKGFDLNSGTWLDSLGVELSG